MLRDEQCCPAACRKSHLFVLRSEMSSDSQNLSSRSTKCQTAALSLPGLPAKELVPMCTFAQLFCECGLYSFIFLKNCPNAMSPVKTNQNQRRGVVLSWPLQITRMLFLKWIFRFLILYYILFCIPVYSWRLWWQVWIRYWKHAFINDGGKQCVERRKGKYEQDKDSFKVLRHLYKSWTWPTEQSPWLSEYRESGADCNQKGSVFLVSSWSHQFKKKHSPMVRLHFFS